MKNQDLEIQTKLLNHYEMVIEKVKGMDDVWDIHGYLMLTNTRQGLCYCAYYEFYNKIDMHDWVKKFKNPLSSYWYDTPYSRNTKPEILEALQFRADKLKEIINSNN